MGFPLMHDLQRGEDHPEDSPFHPNDPPEIAPNARKE